MTGIDKTVNGSVSLLMSMAKESASMGNKGTLANAGLSLLGKRFKRKFMDQD